LIFLQSGNISLFDSANRKYLGLALKVWPSPWPWSWSLMTLLTIGLQVMEYGYNAKCEASAYIYIIVHLYTVRLWSVWYVLGLFGFPPLSGGISL